MKVANCIIFHVKRAAGWIELAWTCRFNVVKRKNVFFCENERKTNFHLILGLRFEPLNSASIVRHLPPIPIRFSKILTESFFFSQRSTTFSFSRSERKIVDLGTDSIFIFLQFSNNQLPPKLLLEKQNTVQVAVRL